MKTDSGNIRIAKNTLFLAIRMFFVLLITLFTTRLVLSALGVEDYGVYNVVFGVVTMGAFINTSLSHGIQRFFNFELAKNGEAGAIKVYNNAVYMQLGMALLLIILGETIGVWYVSNKLIVGIGRMNTAKLVFQFSLFSFALMIIETPFLAVIMAYERMSYYAFVSVLDAILKLIIAIVISHYYKDRLLLYGILISTLSIIKYLLYFVYIRHNFKKIKFTGSFDWLLFRNIMSFSGWNILTTFAGITKNQGVDIIINRFFGPAMNAARGIASQVFQAFNNLISTITTATRPQTIQSYAVGNRTRTMNMMYTLSKVTLYIVYIVGLPIAIETEFILKLWLGASVPEYATMFVRLSVVLALFDKINTAVTGVVHATGKMKLYNSIVSIINIMTLPLVYFFFRIEMPVEFAYYVAIFIALMVQVSSLFVLKKLVNFSIYEYLKAVIIPFVIVVIVTALFPIIPCFLMKPGIMRLCIVTFLSIVVCVPCIYYWGINDKERDLLKEVTHTLINRT